MTPSIKSAIMWISLTSNVFLLGLGYLVITGKIERAPTNYVDLIQPDPFTKGKTK